MNTLVVYDNKGTVFLQVTGNYLLPQGGVQYLEEDIPEGQRLVGVDVSVTPHQVILENIPPSEVDALKTTVSDLTYQLMLKGVL